VLVAVITALVANRAAKAVDGDGGG
jgi:hypothetical protein